MVAYAPGDFCLVTTVYNAERFLGRYLQTIDELVGQSGAQVVIVDDGSTDNTLAIIKARAGDDRRIKIVDLPRMGRSKALNVGIQSADRPLIAIQDVDDVALPNRLRCLAAAVNRYPDAALFATSGLRVDEELLRASSNYQRLVSSELAAPHYRVFDASDIFNRNFLIHSAVAFRQTDWEAVGQYDPGLPSCIDLDFYFRLLGKGRGIIASPQTVICSFNRDSFFRIRSNRQYRSDLFFVLRKAFSRNRIRFPDMVIGYARALRYTVLRFPIQARSHGHAE